MDDRTTNITFDATQLIDQPFAKPWTGKGLSSQTLTYPIHTATANFRVGDKVRLVAPRFLDIISIDSGTAGKPLTIEHCHITIAPGSTFFVIGRYWNETSWIYTLSPFNRPDHLGQSGWSFGNVPETEIEPA